MIAPKGASLACLYTCLQLAAACGDPQAAGFAGTTGANGGGGVGGDGTFVSCTELPNGCADGNDCTVDGNCESITGMCIGREPEPRDTPCGPDGIFVCDGEGSCVGCNSDEQCAPFFPDEECRVTPRCIGQACPLPEPLPNGTPCSTGECRDGVCTSPWAPKEQLVPMICGASFGNDLFAATMTLAVAPTPISSTESFSATIETSIRLPRALIQQVVTGRFPQPLDTMVISDARAEVESTGVVAGTPVETTLNPLPQEVAISQVTNFGDAGGQSCDRPTDCPLFAFGQRCGSGGACSCVCRPGCVPSQCPNRVVADVVLQMEPIQGAIYRALSEGSVCFDAGGDYNDPSPAGRVRHTGAQVTSALGRFAVECAGGSIDDNDSPGSGDDIISPNAPESQVCFPIAEP